MSLWALGEQEEAVFSEDSPTAIKIKAASPPVLLTTQSEHVRKAPSPPQLQPILKRTPLVPYEFHFLIFSFKLAHRITCFPMTFSYILALVDINLD